jgi:hypothetical protein
MVDGNGGLKRRTGICSGWENVNSMEAVFEPSWLLVDNPFRPLDWRWRCAGYLAVPRRGRKPRWQTTHVDQHILFAVDFLRHRSKRGPAGHLDHSIDQACQLFERGRECRWRVEARLLAGQSYEQVAAAEQLAAGVVFWFSTLFFDVGNHLDAYDYIAVQALKLRSLSAPTDRSSQLKALAYFGGLSVLEAVISVSGRQATSTEADSSMQAAVRAVLLADQVPAKEWRLAVTLLRDKPLIEGTNRTVPSWITAGIRPLAANRVEKERFMRESCLEEVHSAAYETAPFCKTA